MLANKFTQKRFFTTGSSRLQYSNRKGGNSKMAGFLTSQELAEKWGVTTARITAMCSNGKIEGAKKEKGRWKIPSDIKKPEDGRKKLPVEKLDGDFTFVDLFAGIGGFHQAMHYLGGRCVMAAEKNQACVDTYSLNFRTAEGYVRGDVNKIDPTKIAPFDVLCAGFPCQPFSKAGLQQGFEDEKSGNLFYKILDILDVHPEVEFIVLENVRNLADKSENWEVISTELLKRDFIITRNPLILSPSDFGIPQIRERVYILGVKKGHCCPEIQKKGCIDIGALDIKQYMKKCKPGDALTILEDDVPEDCIVSQEESDIIDAWDEFRIGTGIQVIGFPIWLQCFGIREENTDRVKKEIKYDEMPEWKQKYVDKNRAFYLQHKDFIDAWVDRHDMLNKIKIFQKFEWNCGTDVQNMHDGIIQIRQSGIRVKRTTFFPSLVAIVNTPIIWDNNFQAYRHITTREAANLQSFRKTYKFDGTDKQIYRQLGNSVNVRVLKIICKNLFNLRRAE